MNCVKLSTLKMSLQPEAGRFKLLSLYYSLVCMRAFLRASVASGLLLALGSSAAVFDYSAPLQNITASSSFSTVTLSVLDAGAGVIRTTNISSSTFDLVSANGVAAWSSGNTVYSFIYEPTRTNWVGNITVSGSPSFAPQTSKGVVTWIVGNTVYFRVYDQARTNWIAGSSATGGTPSSLTVADGVVAWSTFAGVAFVVYDPARGQWVGDGAAIPVSHVFSQMVNTNGVVAWSTVSGASVGNIYAYVYDPTRGGWRPSSSDSGPAFDLTTANGVVAWSRNPFTLFQVYDPSRGQWIGNAVNDGFTANLTISNSTVYWTGNSGAGVVGYLPATGLWQLNALSRPLAYFSVSTNSGNAPLPVYFIDMSIGAASWNWNFDDGGPTSTAESPFYRYRSFNRHNVTLTVANGIGFMSSTNRVIISDITAPSGTVLVNNGATTTTNIVVNLQLTATDNSGVVSSNRISNNNSAWSPWENFSTNKVWSLTNGNGTKTVYVQYSDLAGNVSASANDTIQLDTNRPPVVSFVSTNVSEAVGTAMIQVTLSHSYNQTVSVRCNATNGTAIAGEDYTPTSMLLQFTPGTTVQIFLVPILQNTRDELNKTVLLQFSDVTNAEAAPAGLLTIVDDDPPQLTAPRVNGSGQFQTTLLSAPGQRFEIQISSTLTNWTTLTVFTNANGMMQFTDTTSPGVPVRFYRTLLLP